MFYSSFDEGFREMYPRLVRTLMVASGDRELSADLAQESLAKAYANWNKVNEYELPLAWVRKVAINQLHDEFRKQSRRNTQTNSDILELSTLETIESCMPTPLAVDFAHALEKLPPQQRIAATLKYVDDCSIREIADIMGISEGSVKTHLHHARTALSQTLSTALD